MGISEGISDDEAEEVWEEADEGKDNDGEDNGGKEDNGRGDEERVEGNDAR